MGQLRKWPGFTPHAAAMSPLRGLLLLRRVQTVVTLILRVSARVRRLDAAVSLYIDYRWLPLRLSGPHTGRGGRSIRYLAVRGGVFRVLPHFGRLKRGSNGSTRSSRVWTWQTAANDAFTLARWLVF
jgi:hypothetical protein